MRSFGEYLCPLCVPRSAQVEVGVKVRVRVGLLRARVGARAS
jgi:hypothetical protein